MRIDEIRQRWQTYREKLLQHTQSRIEHDAYEDITFLLLEVDRLTDIVELAKGAFGEHPDAEMDLADEIGRLRHSERQMWNKLWNRAEKDAVKLSKEDARWIAENPDIGDQQ